ncbi:VOC family protein [Fredinandcohnia sp. 179-A 10B2 NHS]|uniref:VOC family protein n=1 Tax=Fredinandcohnia sp. 179-A 10B2 NHS TaxID=3235176 RepID=UPI0039A3A96D
MKWHHVGIQVQNMEESIRFYKNCFDFSVEQLLELEGERVVFLKSEEIIVELVEPEEKEPTLDTKTIHFSWQVSDLSNWMEQLAISNLLPIEGPLVLNNGWSIVFYQGPNQEIIELIECKKKPTKFSGSSIVQFHAHIFSCIRSKNAIIL